MTKSLQDSNEKPAGQNVNGGIEEEYHDAFADTDRVYTDRYDITISLRRDINGFSIGALVNSGMIGPASFNEYWHFTQDESKTAKQTFKQVKETVVAMKQFIEKTFLPHVLIRPMLIDAMRDIDVEHKAKTGVYLHNRSLLMRLEPDWRRTLYGPRYPHPPSTDCVLGADFGKNINVEDEPRIITVENAGNPRKRVYKMKQGDK
jgi:hypothetical protein